MLASRDIDPLPLVVSGTNTPHIHGQKTTSFIGGQWEKWPLNTKKVKEINPRVTWATQSTTITSKMVAPISIFFQMAIQGRLLQKPPTCSQWNIQIIREDFCCNNDLATGSWMQKDTFCCKYLSNWLPGFIFKTVEWKEANKNYRHSLFFFFKHWAHSYQQKQSSYIKSNSDL